MLRSATQRYLIIMAIGVIMILGVIWLYILSFPRAFMEGAYAMWSAKHDFISRCDLGNSLVVGDSRADAAIEPRKLDRPTRNVSIGGGSPLEGYFFLREALQCDRAPRQVVLSYAMSDFTEVSQDLWENGARFGFINYSELHDILATAVAIGDNSVDKTATRIGFGGELRNALYGSRFPPLYFNALVSARFFGRYGANQAIYEKTREDLGHVDYVRIGTSHTGGIPGDFAAAAVQSAYFERTLELLRQHNIEAFFVAMPVSPHDMRETKPAANVEFEAYLLAFAKRFPNFHLVRPLVVVWPQGAFEDGVYIDASFASRFSERFNRCQDAMELHSGAVVSCDLSW